jgi:glycosyltransferase involved in cell wall biosynthesis
VSEPLVSVILTTYNRRGILPRAVDSVLNGSYANVELIILDDASTDGTAEYASTLRDPRVRYLRIPVNAGVLHTRNRGFDAARGDFVTLLDDDDELTRDALATVVREFARLAGDGVEILWLDCVDVESAQRSGVVPPGLTLIRFDDYLCGKLHGDFWLAFRRSALSGYRFDERLRAQESLLWLRIHRAHRAWYVPQVVCRKYRRHGGERLCDLDVRMRQLEHTTLAMQQFDSEFGAQLAALSRSMYGSKLAYLGLHQMATGHFASGRASVLRSLRYRFSGKYLLVYLGSWCVSARTVAGMIRRIESAQSGDS